MKTTYFYSCLLAVGIPWSSMVSGQCPQNKYGPDCRYDCHCGRGVSCEPQTGCKGNCADDWLGNHCQARNVALRRPTAESPQSICRAYKSGTICDHSVLAVDGKRGHNFHTLGGCSHAGNDDGPPRAQWNVTLDQEYDIYRFIIDSRNDCCGWRLSGFILSVGRTSEVGFNYQLCYRDHTKVGPSGKGPGDTIHGHCIDTPLRGNVVQIRQSTFYPLTLCEVIIYICSPGWYGQECNMECSTTTACLRCDDRRLRCDECVQGRWGEDCQQSCLCPDGPCKKPTGLCFCPAGYKGDHCDIRCLPGEYGIECTHTCGYCTEGREACNRTTGECPDRSPDPRCQPGYKGANCDQRCDEGKHGPDCRDRCANCAVGRTVCNTTTGECPDRSPDPRCQPGYKGANCDQICDEGKHGPDCRDRCANCAVGRTVCNTTTGECPDRSPNPRCQRGYKGANCDQRCDEGKHGPDCRDRCANCAVGRTVCNTTTGECPDRSPDPRCQPGYKGANCDQECSPGFYGADCQELCGNCSRISLTCHHVEGTCDSCSPGWNGTFCKDPCLAGFYGEDCGETCGNCLVGVDRCDVVTGECLSGAQGRCAKGFTGRLCKTECPLGQYGVDCKEVCGICAGCRHECHRVTGICPGDRTPRCGLGRKGIRCNIECSLGEFGADCAERCGLCAEGQDQCDRETGNCPDRQPARCVAGWGGDRCDTALLNDTEELARLAELQREGSCLGVVLGTSLAIAAAATVVILTLLYLLRRPREKPNPDIMLLSAEEPIAESTYPTDQNADTNDFPKYSTLPEDEHL